MPACFVKDGPDAERRREILRDHAMRSSEVIETMSYYELWSIPTDELLALAVEQERTSEKGGKLSSELRQGITADNFVPYPEHKVYGMPKNPKNDLVQLKIIDVSNCRFLLDCQHPDGHMIVPANMVFVNRNIAEFMRREILAYESDLDAGSS
jgi:hypothetical protein